MSNQIAETILKQIGGANKVKAMIGAKNFLAGDSSLGFAFKGCKKANVCKITLNASDTYEAVGAMPGQGGTSMLHFGESIGIVKGVLGSLGIPVRFVTPQRWKKAAGLIGKEKDCARSLAIQLHPEIANQLTRKKDGGRADAIGIAHFG